MTKKEDPTMSDDKDFVQLTLGSTKRELDEVDAERERDGNKWMRVRFHVPGYMRQQRDRYATPDFTTPLRQKAERAWIVASVANVFSIRQDFAEYLLTVNPKELREEVDGDALVCYLPARIAKKYDPPFVEPSESQAAYDRALPAFKAAQKAEDAKRFA